MPCRSRSRPARPARGGSAPVRAFVSRRHCVCGRMVSVRASALVGSDIARRRRRQPRGAARKPGKRLALPDHRVRTGTGTLGAAFGVHSRDRRRLPRLQRIRTPCGHQWSSPHPNCVGRPSQAPVYRTLRPAHRHAAPARPRIADRGAAARRQTPPPCQCDPPRGAARGFRRRAVLSCSYPVNHAKTTDARFPTGRLTPAHRRGPHAPRPRPAG